MCAITPRRTRHLRRLLAVSAIMRSMSVWSNGAAAGLLQAEQSARGKHQASQFIRKNIVILSVSAYDPGMASLDQFVDDRLLHGRAHFDCEEALAAVDLKPGGLTAAITRLIKKRLHLHSAGAEILKSGGYSLHSHPNSYAKSLYFCWFLHMIRE